MPTARVMLASLPTPITRLRPFSSPLVDPAALAGIEIHLKRDDLSSFDLGGNKVRKLEFLLADALQRGFDSVITIGGLQSNHCRATAVAARQLGLTPVLILRTELTAEQISLEGNLLLSRMAGAKIYTVTPEDYYEKVSLRKHTSPLYLLSIQKDKCSTFIFLVRKQMSLMRNMLHCVVATCACFAAVGRGFLRAATGRAAAGGARP